MHRVKPIELFKSTDTIGLHKRYLMLKNLLQTLKISVKNFSFQHHNNYNKQ